LAAERVELAHGIARVRGDCLFVPKRLPVLNLLAIAGLASVARQHLRNLNKDERRRLARLVRRGFGPTGAR
jgi:hypothetical protein